MRLIRVPLFLLALGAAPAGAQPAELVHVTLAPSSRIWISGRTNINAWSCVSSHLDDAIAVDSAPAVASLGSAPEHPAGTTIAATLSVPVASLDCGRRQMERDLRNALHADVHPQIRFRMQSYQVSPTTTGFDGTVSGELTLNGTARAVTVAVTIVSDARGHYRATGSTEVRMSTFGVHPPTAFFGAIRAGDAVRVSFDLSTSEAQIASVEH